MIAQWRAHSDISRVIYDKRWTFEAQAEVKPLKNIRQYFEKNVVWSSGRVLVDSYVMLLVFGGLISPRAWRQ